MDLRRCSEAQVAEPVGRNVPRDAAGPLLPISSDALVSAIDRWGKGMDKAGLEQTDG